MDEEARRHQGHGIMAASPPARAVIVVQSEVEDHSAHQRRDRNGRVRSDRWDQQHALEGEEDDDESEAHGASRSQCAG